MFFSTLGILQVFCSEIYLAPCLTIVITLVWVQQHSIETCPKLNGQLTHWLLSDVSRLIIYRIHVLITNSKSLGNKNLNHKILLKRGRGSNSLVKFHIAVRQTLLYFLFNYRVSRPNFSIIAIRKLMVSKNGWLVPSSINNY